MCPVKYTGECRTISQAAERADSLASGTITSGDLGLSLPFLLLSLLFFFCPYWVFSPSVFSFLPVSMSPLLELQLRQSSNNPHWQTLTSCVYLYACIDMLMFFMYLCTICDLICISVCVCVCVWAHLCACRACGGSRSQWNSSDLSGTV